MSKPTDNIEWATAVGSEISEPTLAQKQDGWDNDDMPPAGWLNWWKRGVYRWKQWFESTADDTAKMLGMLALRGMKEITVAEANDWWGVTWSPSLKKFVAIAGSGTNRLMTSKNGTSWTLNALPTSDGYGAVVWSPDVSLFVTVGFTGTKRAMTSTDGTTWLQWTAAEMNSWQDVCWSQFLSKFVAVSSNGTNRVMTSSDGQTWSAVAAAEANDWRRVCSADSLGKLVAVAQTGTNRVMTSTNGTTWTAVSVPTGTYYGVCWSPELNLLVATGHGTGAKVITSSDGVTWTESVGAPAGYCVVWCKEISAFISFDSDVSISYDGVNWVSYATLNSCISACWSPELKRVVATSTGATYSVNASA